MGNLPTDLSSDSSFRDTWFHFVDLMIIIGIKVILF